eukprot:2798728-Pleurochrysis_carterae.AAC.4
MTVKETVFGRVGGITKSIIGTLTCSERWHAVGLASEEYSARGGAAKTASERAEAAQCEILAAALRAIVSL